MSVTSQFWAVVSLPSHFLSFVSSSDLDFDVRVWRKRTERDCLGRRHHSARLGCYTNLPFFGCNRTIRCQWYLTRTSATHKVIIPATDRCAIYRAPYTKEATTIEHLESEARRSWRTAIGTKCTLHCIVNLAKLCWKD